MQMNRLTKLDQEPILERLLNDRINLSRWTSMSTDCKSIMSLDAVRGFVLKYDQSAIIELF